MYDFQFPSSGGNMGGMGSSMILNYLVIALLLILIVSIVTLCVILILRMRAIRKNGGMPGRNGMPWPAGMVMPPREELTKTQATRILMECMKDDDIPEQTIRERMIGQYQIEPVIVDALLVQISRQEHL